MTQFEQYLNDIHAEQYTGLDDEMSDDFDDWFQNLENYELIEYVNKFISTI